MHKIWTEKAEKGEFTIKIKIRLGTQEQLLETTRQDDRINGRVSEVFASICWQKPTAFCWAESG